MAGPKLWNQLPGHIRSIDSLNAVKCLLKLFIFKKAFYCSNMYIISVTLPNF